MDAEQLDKHLAQTCDMIKRHRGRILPGGIGYQDNPTFNGFGPKSPCSEHAMELGDLEAAFIGNLARYCMAIGSVPHRPRKGFWWIDGECKGLKGGLDEDEFDFFGNDNGFDYLHEIRELIEHLRTWAPQIVKTEGVEELLSAGEDIRWYSLKMFPQEDMDWISEGEACKVSNRRPETLRQWRLKDWVECIDDNWGTLYSRKGIEVTVAAMDHNESKNHFRRS